MRSGGRRVCERGSREARRRLFRSSAILVLAAARAAAESGDGFLFADVAAALQYFARLEGAAAWRTTTRAHAMYSVAIVTLSIRALDESEPP